MPGRMKSIIQKRIIPARTQSQDEKFSSRSVDHVKYEGQVRLQHLLLVQFSH